MVIFENPIKKQNFNNITIGYAYFIGGSSNVTQHVIIIECDLVQFYL